MIILAAALLAVATIGAPPVHASNYSRNVAGRPMGGNAQYDCNGTVYGQVNGFPVLFTAEHCLSNRFGAYVTDGDGVTIGQVMKANEETQSTVNYDMGWIWLRPGGWPANPNQIYRGVNGSGDTLWFTNTSLLGSNQLDCNSISQYFGGTVGIYESWHSSFADTRLATGGKIKGGTSNFYPVCHVETSIYWHGPTYVDSGSPFFVNGYLNTIFGVGSSRTGTAPPSYNGQGPNYLIVSPWADAMDDLNYEFTHNGYSAGANFCTTSDCNGYMP